MRIAPVRARLLVAGLLLLTPGCANIARLGEIGRPPRLATPAIVPAPPYAPTLDSRGAQGRLPSRELGAPAAASASLFQPQGRSLFRDQRASRVGDILTVRIDIADRAEVDNSTSRSRDSSASVGLPALGGLEGLLGRNADPLLDARGGTQTTGTGQTARSEKVSMTVAAVVTDVLPNGNLVIRARQQVRVNFELRDLTVTGLVRPEDIELDNTVRHSQIAEARIAYGGRGVLSDVQQPGWLQQVTDVLAPY